MSAEFVDELPESINARNSGPFMEFAAELRANPGRWAKYPSKKLKTQSVKANTVSNIRRGRSAAFPKEEFEAALRNGVVYVRAVPK